MHGNCSMRDICLRTAPTQIGAHSARQHCLVARIKQSPCSPCISVRTRALFPMTDSTEAGANVLRYGHAGHQSQGCMCVGVFVFVRSILAVPCDFPWAVPRIPSNRKYQFVRASLFGSPSPRMVTCHWLAYLLRNSAFRRRIACICLLYCLRCSNKNDRAVGISGPFGRK